MIEVYVLKKILNATSEKYTPCDELYGVYRCCALPRAPPCILTLNEREENSV